MSVTAGAYWTYLNIPAPQLVNTLDNLKSSSEKKSVFVHMEKLQYIQSLYNEVGGLLVAL
jgi:hypothetical protein